MHIQGVLNAWKGVWMRSRASSEEVGFKWMKIRRIKNELNFQIV